MVPLLLLAHICLLFTIASYPNVELRNPNAYNSFPIQHNYGLGEHCARFEDEAQELCTSASKPGSKRLAILMANCNLETLGQEPFLYNDEGLLNATEVQKAVAVNMVTQLPVFCATLNVLGLRMGLMTDQKMTRLNEALENLKGLSHIAFKFERANNQTVDIQKEILEQTQRGTRHAVILREMAAAIENRMDNFTLGLDQLLEKYEQLSARWDKLEFDKSAAHALVNITVREAQLYWAKAQGAETQSIVRKVEQQLRVLQIIFGMSIIGADWYLFTLTRRGMPSAIFLAILITSTYGMYMFNFTALSTRLFNIDVVKKAVNNFGRTASPALQELTGSISINGSFNGQYILIFCCAVLSFLAPLLISKFLRRTSTTSRRRGLRMNGFDIHNSEEVIKFLQEQEANVQQVESDLAAIIHDIKRVISRGEAQENALFTRFSGRSSSRQYERIQNPKRKATPGRRKTEGVISKMTPKSRSIPISELSRPDIRNKSYIELVAKGKRRPPSPKSNPKQKFASKARLKPLVILGNDTDEEHDTDVTEFSLHSLSENSLRNSSQNSTIITGDEEPIPQGREPSVNSSVQSNDSSMTTVISEWDGIPLYHPQGTESSDVDMQDNVALYENEQLIDRDDLTTQVTEYAGSSGATTSTWSRDSLGMRTMDEFMTSRREVNYPFALEEDEIIPAHAQASIRVAKPILRPRGSHKERHHRRLSPRSRIHGREQISEQSNSSSGTETRQAANTRRAGRRIKPMFDNIAMPMTGNPHLGENKTTKNLKDTSPLSCSGRERANGLPADVGEPFSGSKIPEEISSFPSQAQKSEDTNASKLEPSPKSVASQTSRQVSRSKNNSKNPSIKSSQTSTTPSNYNLRRR